MEEDFGEVYEDSYQAFTPIKTNLSNEQTRKLDVKFKDDLDLKLGFIRFTDGDALGWLVNMQETVVEDPLWEGGRSAVDFYFIREDGSTFKATLVRSPYLLIGCRGGTVSDVEEYLRRKYEKIIERIARVEKEDLDLNNHLVGLKHTYLQLFFRNTEDLTEVRRSIMPVINSNKKKYDMQTDYSDLMNAEYDSDGEKIISKGYRNADEQLVEMREYDVPYIARIAIDNDFRVGLWYSVSAKNGAIEIVQQFDKVLPAEPVVLAFDIETSKLPLKFPDAASDQIMMISYMIDRQGFLITNREIVSADIEDFEYSPRIEYEGHFTVFNEKNERDLLLKFFDHIIAVKPSVFVTYNGDFFDWPFIETRAKYHDIDMHEKIGWYRSASGDYMSSYAAHMDCFRWVKRDSYLPVGSQGLKAVTKYKLGYDPKELDPELMTPYAASNPHILADYSVSDAVATYYLYMKYVHPFVFSLCNIIPLSPDDVLRKGSGTLCEMLLMVEAFKANVVMPNKHVEEKNKFFQGHLLESETYVGGHVEALESGVFRSDLPSGFRIDPETVQGLISDVDRALRFYLETEEKLNVDDVQNFEEVKDLVTKKLEALRDKPVRNENPLIYHLDVAAMYPNIILTNRLQPPALVDEETCALCDFNKPESNCQRKMKWSWRGEFFAADRSEYNMIRNQLEAELFEAKRPNDQLRKWTELSSGEQNSLMQKRLAEYSRKVYRRIRETKVEEKESIVCQRENSFYVDTVRNFRDRRYEYKSKLKVWKKKLDDAIVQDDLIRTEEAKKMIVLMDSLQLAHKCILNSFYGYVMRKGSRWYSMEMAGIVCSTGSKIIQMARQLVERIGRPLELDTDGIWCILPKSFPENYRFQLSSGKELQFSYPCVMLNHLVHDRFTNDQYQTLVDPENFVYETHSENSIFFEVDGPYRAMILPASKEENKLLKKRYAVFNDDGSLAELKGFEVKRRGELKIIKVFQEEVFKMFLEGSTLFECYESVATVANRWLDLLFTRGKYVNDDELMEYISENRSMSKKLEDYGKQKSTSISTAKRLAELLGEKMVQDAGLACKFIIASRPVGAPVADRAIPVVVFSVETNVRNHFLRKWLKDDGLVDFDIRTILDWDYYIERLGSTIQKLVTIPAAMQQISNPVPKLPHPDWLLKRSVHTGLDIKQRKITDMFQKRTLVGTIENHAQSEAHIEAINIETHSEDFGEALENPVEPPSIYGNYTDWLIYQQGKWRRMLKDRKEKGYSERDGTGLVSYFNKRNRSLMNSFWEIIQVVETETPGEFKLWALVDKTLQSFRLRVRRSFYVNCREPDNNQDLRKVAKTLPRSLVSFFLYEFDREEIEYLREIDIYRNFAWHHDTVGVFETSMSLDFKCLLSLGSVCVANRSVVKKSVESVFSCDDFSRKEDAAESYLSGGRVGYVFIYHSQQDSRMILSVFFFSKGKLELVVVDPNGNQAMPNIGRLYREAIEKQGHLLEDDELLSGFKYPEKTESTVVSFVNEEKKAFKHLQKMLVDFQSKRPGPTVILIQSPRSQQYFASKAKVILEFPCVYISANPRDNNYPPLDWQKYAATRMMRSLVYIRDSFVDMLIISRYAQIPVSNIGDDPLIFVADLHLSRLLAERNIVSWFSNSQRPDLGGREDDDNVFESEPLLDPELNVPSFYQSVCVEFSLEDLCVNAILQSTFINELDGSDGNAGLSAAEMISLDKHFSTNHDFIDINSPSFRAFKCLKDVIRIWAKDYHLHQNSVAKILLKNCYRWICSASSRIYDPSILNHVHNLMEKSLLLLLSEFKRLGSKIVYATFNRVIIATSKTEVANALAYNEFILKSLHSKDAFAFITLKTTRVWSNLLWFDSCNFAGFSGDKACIDMSMAEVLPTFVRDIFVDVIQDFILKITELLAEHYDVGENKKTLLTAKFQNLINTHFTRRLLDIVPMVSRKFTEQSTDFDADPESLQSPKIPGQNVQSSNNCVLQFINAIGHLFSLNADIQHEVRLMKRQLLRLLGINEFSAEAEFKSPVESFIINNVMCSYCQYCRDVDLAFDYDGLKQSNDEHKITVGSYAEPWHCPKCLHAYDLQNIEDVLVSMVHRSVMSYQIQDLSCTKCNMVKRENLRNTCKTCASNYKLHTAKGKNAVEMLSNGDHYSPLSTVDADRLSKKYDILKDIARVHDMKYLQEVITFISAH